MLDNNPKSDYNKVRFRIVFLKQLPRTREVRSVCFHPTLSSLPCARGGAMVKRSDRDGGVVCVKVPAK